MKIALGTNIFGSYHRQDMCLKSLKRLKTEFPDIIDLYDIQIIEDYKETDGFTCINELTKTSKDIIKDSSKDKPIVKEMFDVLSNIEGYDYFIFTNSDIIISNRFIQLIINSPDMDSFSASRLTIKNIDYLEQTPELVQYQVAGFDTFAVKSKWWREHRNKFPDYIFSEPCWDVHYATLLKKYGKSMFVNKWPACVFHIEHEIAWSDMTPERSYNENMLFKTYKNDSDMWHNFLFNVLLKRSPKNGFYNPFPDEEDLEKRMFNE